MTEQRFDLPPIHENLDAKASAAEAIRGIEAVADGLIDRYVMEEHDGDVTVVTQENATAILKSRFDQDNLGSFHRGSGTAE